MKHRLRDRNLKITDKKDILQEDPYKLSIHSSANFNKSDSGSKRLNLSRMLENSRKKISMRKASELFQSGVRPHSSKVSKRNEVIEFDNMKWISIISAYDPTRLKNVSVSKKTCQKFLETQGQYIKTDSRNMLYFNDLIKNFKSWLNKIHIQYFYIMQNFLYGKRSVNVTLAELRPKINEVINQTSHMQQNLENCLKSYENHQFRQLLRKYHAYLQNSKEIEDIIIIVNKSKTKIVDLYKKFDDDKKIEQKLNRVKNDGIHKVKKIICEHNQIQIQNQIMDRIQTAINEMAEKSGEAYRKIRGIKQLIFKFKNTEYESGQVMKKLDMDAINLMGKVCREICFEANAFDTFSSKFLLEGDIINDDLKNIIRKYQEDMAIQRKRAIELQMKFLNIILSETIKKLKENSKICAVYQNIEVHHEEYRKVLRMIQDVADCLIDQNKKASLQKLIKQTKTVFDRLYDELKYLKENKKFEEIDTEEGLISILEVNKLIKEYKQKILLVRKKFETAHRDILMTPLKIQQIMHDKQTNFIDSVISLSKKINNSDLKDRIGNVPCFSPVSHQIGLIKMSQQINDENILEDIKAISNEFLELQEQNILEQFFGPLKLENLIFKESIIMLNFKKLSLKTQEKNIIPQLTQLLKKRNQWVEKHKKISSEMKMYFERILASFLVKGLKAQDIKQIQNPRSIPFPTKENQIEPLKSKAKYRQVLFDLIQNSVIETTESLQNKASDQVEFHEQGNSKVTQSKNNYFVCDILQKNIANINNFINSFTKITHIKKNINSETFLAKQYLIEFSEKLFTMTCFNNPIKGNKSDKDRLKISNWVQSLIKICSDRILSLTRVILLEENEWRMRQKKKKLENSVDINKLPVHVQKVIQILDFYKNKIIEMSDCCAQALEVFNKPIKNVENSKQVVDEYSKLSLYANVLVSVVKYCKQTQQIVHIILDNSKSPIALINPKENSLKQMFSGLKKGKLLTLPEIQKLSLTVPKIGIQLKFKTFKGESSHRTSNKQKKYIKKDSQMDEDIVEASQVSMKEEIPDEDVEEINDFEQEMPQDEMGEEVEQEPQELMIQDFEAPEEQNSNNIEQEKLEELMEESQNLGKSKNRAKSKNEIDDFQEYDWQEDDQKNKKKRLEVEKKSKPKKSKQNEEEKKIQLSMKKEQEQDLKTKQKELEERQKRMKKQHIIFSQTQPPKKIIQYSVYQILSFITSLHQLKSLISYICSFEEIYMKNKIHWSKIQQYFNSHYVSQSKTKEEEKAKMDVEKYMKNLDEEIDNQLKIDFQSEPNVFNQIKTLETVKKLKKNCLLLKNSNWQTLQKMLLANNVTYNVLKSDKSILYIFIKDSALEYDEYGSIDGYLSKNFKYYKKSQFDIKNFADKCFSNFITNGTKNQSFKIITYVAKNQRSLIKNQTQIENTYEKLKVILKNFSNGAKDHVNKFDLCLDLYKKALQIKEKVELDLTWYSDQIKFLQKSGTEQNDILSYVTFIKDNIKNVIKKIKSLESKLYNLSFKCEKNNIFECFEELSELYGDQIELKQVFKKGDTNFMTFIFDKTNYQENLNKIKMIMSNQPNSKENYAQKIIISLLLGSQCQITKEIEQHLIHQNSSKLVTKQYELLLDILCTLRVSHSYILIKEKNIEFFTLNKKKEECISNFLKKMVESVLQNKSISTLVAANSFLSPLRSLQNSTDYLLYQKVFAQQKIKTLFKENLKETTYLKQTEIIVNQDGFDLTKKNWNQDSQKIIKEIFECSQNEKKQCEKLLDHMTKLKPCKLIYEKYLSSDKPQQILSLWSENSDSFQKMLLTASQLTKKKHWLLTVNSIISELQESIIKSIKETLEVISYILLSDSKNKSLKQIESQVSKVFKWIKSLVQRDSKHKFLVVTRSGQQSLLYFDLNIEQISLEYFIQNCSFIQPNNVELKQFVFNLIFKNLTQQKSEEIKSSLQLQNKDIFYQIDSQKIFTSVFSIISKISSQEYYEKRHKTIRQFVRSFNKIYFVSRTTKNLNFKQQSQVLQKLQSEIKKDLKQLELVYSFKKLIQNYGGILLQGRLELVKLKNLFENEFIKNEKIPDDEISDILAKLEKIKVNKNSCLIDSYEPFFAWVYHTVMSLLNLPFYNIITHTVLNSQSQVQTQFLAVVVTQKSTDPGQKNEQLESCLKEMFVFKEHKSIYLKENDLTVELTKQPAFIEFSLTIKDLQLKQIIEFLNQNCEQDIKSEDYVKKELYIRVDELGEKTSLKGKTSDQQIFLSLIPLKDFLKSSEQQFNLQITQKKLCSSIECNIIYAPLQISDQTNLQEFLPLNGSSVDFFDDVYMGKILKLDKLKEWLYTFYKSRKNQVDTKNRQIELENLCKQFIDFQKNDTQPENEQLFERIFKYINFQTINQSKSSSKQNRLFLSSSLIFKQKVSKNLKIFKENLYHVKPQIEVLYDLDINQLFDKILSFVHNQFQVLERENRVNMEKRIKKLASQKVEDIKKKYDIQKQKKLFVSNQIVDVPQSQKQINPPEEQKGQQTPERTQVIKPIVVPVEQKQTEEELMKNLREKEFSEYFEKMLELRFQSFDKSSEKKIKSQIFIHFREKISACKHIQPAEFDHLLCQKVERSYEGKEDKQKEKVMFIFLLLQNYDISEAELYLADSQKI